MSCLHNMQLNAIVTHAVHMRGLVSVTMTVPFNGNIPYNKLDIGNEHLS